METSLAISQLDIPAWRDRLEQLRVLDPTSLQLDDDPAWHEPMIREAEQNGHAFAALWHLDRLIAARPDDWYLRALRARAWSLSDKADRFDRAAADLRQAERLGSREQVLDFQAHCVVDCTEFGRWAEALWYLDRLIAARPGRRIAARGPRGGLRQARPRGRPPGRSRPRLRAGGRPGDWSSPGPRSSAAPAAGPRPPACWRAAGGPVRSVGSWPRPG